MATNNAINLPGPTPVFSTALSSTAYNVTGSGTNYQVLFDTVISDTVSGYDNTTGVYTVKTAGTYFLTSHITYGPNAPYNPLLLYIYMSINGVPFQFGLSPLSGQVANYYGPNAWLSFEGSIIVPLSVGNTISVTVQGYGETSDNDGILGALPSVVYQTTFSGFMIAQV